MTVQGKIVDASTGEALQGASIVPSSTGKGGTMTDTSGNFSLTVPDGSYLTVSYVGYLDAILPSTSFNNTTVGLKLDTDSTLADAVVVYVKKATAGKPIGFAIKIALIYLALKLFKFI